MALKINMFCLYLQVCRHLQKDLYHAVVHPVHREQQGADVLHRNNETHKPQTFSDKESQKRHRVICLPVQFNLHPLSGKFRMSSTGHMVSSPALLTASLP